MISALLRISLKVLAVVGGVLVAYLAVTAVQVWLTSREYSPRAAGAIVVLGAAQYNGVPSPDLKARLNEALILYRQHDAPIVMLTGGKEPGDRFTEAEAGKSYLEHAGVPADVIEQVGGNDTWQNLAGAAQVLKERGATTTLIVTDPFHEDRSMAIATDVGLTPYPAPTRTSPIGGLTAVPYFAKEAVEVGLGRIIGYQDMSDLR
jgi:uncharacterized SAM-binding protein YcdF (DUF218 family)